MSSLGKQSIKFYVIRSILRRLTRHTTTKKLTTQAPQQEKLWYARIKDYVWMVTFGIAVASGLTLMLKGGRNSGSVIRPLYTVSENSNANNNYNFLRKVVERSAPAVVYVEIIQVGLVKPAIKVDGIVHLEPGEERITPAAGALQRLWVHHKRKRFGANKRSRGCQQAQGDGLGGDHSRRSV